MDVHFILRVPVLFFLFFPPRSSFSRLVKSLLNLYFLFLCRPFCLMHASLMDAPSDLDCLTGDEKTDEEDEEDQERALQTRSREDNRNQNQNHATTVPIASGHYLALVPGNRRPIDPAVAAHFSKTPSSSSSPPPLTEAPVAGHAGGGQLRKLERHQEKLREMQQKKAWLEEERLRLDQQKQLEEQRRDLLQQEHRHRRQVEQQQQLRRSPTGAPLSPSSGLCTIYEAMETGDEEEEDEASGGGANRNTPSRGGAQDFQRQRRPVPPQELEWNRRVDMVQQLINRTLMLSGGGGLPAPPPPPRGAGGHLEPPGEQHVAPAASRRPPRLHGAPRPGTGPWWRWRPSTEGNDRVHSGERD